jgi:hypothetical protein
LRRLAIVLVTIFIITLQRLIGRKSFGEFGFLHFGIKTIKVLLTDSGDVELLRMSKTNLQTSV